MFKVAIFILVAYLAYRLSDLLVVVLASVVIASVIEPLIRFFLRRGMQRIFASAIFICHDRGSGSERIYFCSTATFF
jgi:predicted PurR-regulated permease PerM